MFLALRRLAVAAPLLATFLGACSQTAPPVSARRPPSVSSSAVRPSSRYPTAKIPAAFWHQSTVSQGPTPPIFPRQPGSEATLIQHGGPYTPNYKPFPGTVSTVLRLVISDDLATVPAHLRPLVWRTVGLSETWTEPGPPANPGSQVVGKADRIFVIDRTGRILGQRTTGEIPPEEWK